MSDCTSYKARPVRPHNSDRAALQNAQQALKALPEPNMEQRSAHKYACYAGSCIDVQL